MDTDRSEEKTMKKRAKLRATLALAAAVAMGSASDASAGLFRSYLSVNGSDANPCTLQSPCRLLPAALAAVNDGGEIWMLDSANFNTGTVAVAKSVTILAIPGALGSVVANGGDAVSINAAGGRVTLRNLVILNLSGTLNAGISFLQGAALTGEGCEIYGLKKGVFANATGAVVTIKDTTVRDSDVGIAMAGPVNGQLRNVSMPNNLTAGVSAADGAGVAISGSAISGSSTALAASASSSTTTLVSVSGSTMSGNTTGLQAVAATGADTVQVLLNAVTFTHNGTGISITGATASVITRQNSTFKFNTTDIAGGALTPLTAQ